MSFHATPVTVLTGFLGSGKTTLINHLLKENHGHRLAIIENEYGEVGVDSELIERPDDEAIVQLDNGCVCCTVRGDLANALDRLVKSREAGTIDFDHVVIETTGLADPGPIARTFLAESAILDHYYLDGIVTLVDAVNGVKAISARREARAQIAYADRCFMTKCDLATEDQMTALKSKLIQMNRTAEIVRVSPDDLSSQNIADQVLMIKGFQLDRFDTSQTSSHSVGSDIAQDHSECHLGHEDCDGHHHHDDDDHLSDVVSIYWECERPLDAQQFDLAMAALTDRYGDDLWRIKGLLNVAGSRRRLIVQGVNGLLNINGTTYWRPYEPTKSKLILIGEKLERDAIIALLNSVVINTN